MRSAPTPSHPATSSIGSTGAKCSRRGDFSIVGAGVDFAGFFAFDFADFSLGFSGGFDLADFFRAFATEIPESNQSGNSKS